MSQPTEKLSDVKSLDAETQSQTAEESEHHGPLQTTAPMLTEISRYIQSQLQLEADAKEALPYQFDTCTRLLGPLRQTLFSCLTCNPPPESPTTDYTPAGICYSCSISCHGEHVLVELFSKRDFECDCGTTRISGSAPCTLRTNATTHLQGGVTGESPRAGNKYNHNFAGRFCGCGVVYDPSKEKGTMFQCLGIGSVEEGGCGEDWWHPECLMGLPRNAETDAHEAVNERPAMRTTDGGMHAVTETPQGDHNSHAAATVNHQGDIPLPSGFPAEDDFDLLLCYKCVESSSWIKRYAGSAGFLPALPCGGDSNNGEMQSAIPTPEASEAVGTSAGAKRKAENDDKHDTEVVKRTKVEEIEPAPKTALLSPTAPTPTPAKHESLSPAPPGKVSLFLHEGFRNHLCRCPQCFLHLEHHPQLLEEEEAYEPPISESDPGEGNGTASVGSRSLLDRGEAALSTMDRMRAIEGVMAYNHLKDRVKTFLQPFAESGQAVGAEDIKAYFAKLRGDEEAMRLAAAGADSGGDAGDNRREQSGY